MPVNLTRTSKSLRKNSTDAERLLWRHLRAGQFEGLKFRRQEQIGQYIADFVCFQNRLIIEADGSQHALESEKDEQRTLWLNSQGFRVLRFWDHEILTNLDAVLEAVRLQCSGSVPPLPSPLPRGERE